MINHLFILCKPRAYLDPGTGSLFVQLLVGALAVSSGYLIFFRKKIQSLFSKNKQDKDCKAGTEENQDE